MDSMRLPGETNQILSGGRQAGENEAEYSARAALHAATGNHRYNHERVGRSLSKACQQSSGATCMKVGDRVRHKLSGEAMEIRTIKDGVATCWQVEQEKQWGYSYGDKVFAYPSCICPERNLV